VRPLGLGAALLASALLAAGCRSGTARDRAALDTALTDYATLVLHMDAHGIAALYASDGALGNEGQLIVRGPQAIEEYLRGFDAYHVLAYSAVADTTAVLGPNGYQAGVYHQRVQLPSRDTVEVHGRFQVQWTRQPDGAWRIQRMRAIPER
jgi:uncharacterized protein (TIGR02246 family)